jgi:hypothetical protein
MIDSRRNQSDVKIDEIGVRQGVSASLFIGNESTPHGDNPVVF